MHFLQAQFAHNLTASILKTIYHVRPPRQLRQGGTVIRKYEWQVMEGCWYAIADQRWTIEAILAAMDNMKKQDVELSADCSTTQSHKAFQPTDTRWFPISFIPSALLARVQKQLRRIWLCVAGIGNKARAM